MYDTPALGNAGGGRFQLSPAKRVTFWPVPPSSDMDDTTTAQIEQQLLEEVAAAISAGEDNATFEFVSNITLPDETSDTTWIRIDCWPKSNREFYVNPLQITKLGFCTSCMLFHEGGATVLRIICIYEMRLFKVQFFMSPRSSSDRLRLAHNGLFIQRTSLAGSELMPLNDQVFPLGQMVATPGALEALKESGESPLDFIKRHAEGDWGEIDAEDREANEQALMHGARLLSAYRTRKDTKLWIITEADRSATAILLPEEY